MLRIATTLHPYFSDLQPSNRTKGGSRHLLKTSLACWKTPILISVCFILVHAVVVILFSDVGAVHSSKSYPVKDAKLLNDQPSPLERSIDDGQKNHKVFKRSNGLEKIKEDKYIAADQSQAHISRTDDEFEATNSDEKSSIVTNICHSGHIQGLRSICHDQPCLPQLKIFNEYPSTEIEKTNLGKAATLERFLQPHILQHIHRAQGSFDQLNFPLVSLLTIIQKQFGTYGAVGLVQTNLDKFSSFLAATVDRTAGEKLIVVNSFNSSSRSFSQHSKAWAAEDMPSDKDLYIDHLEKLGFSKELGSVQKRYSDNSKLHHSFHIYEYSFSKIPKEKYLEHFIPQFRIISLSSDAKDPLTVMSGLEMASCTLRDGGVVLVNFDKSESYTLSVVKSLLDQKFDGALSVFLATENKIYITTTNWKKRYVDLILEHSPSIRSGLSTFDTTTGYYK